MAEYTSYRAVVRGPGIRHESKQSRPRIHARPSPTSALESPLPTNSRTSRSRGVSRTSGSAARSVTVPANSPINPATVREWQNRLAGLRRPSPPASSVSPSKAMSSIRSAAAIPGAVLFVEIVDEGRHIVEEAFYEAVRQPTAHRREAERWAGSTQPLTRTGSFGRVNGLGRAVGGRLSGCVGAGSPD